MNLRRLANLNNIIIASVIVSGVGGFLPGCSDSGKKAPAPSVPISSKPAQPIATQATVTQATATVPSQPEYSYNPAGRRDPFSPIIVHAQPGGPKSANLPPLERYALSEFKLTGIVWGGFGYNAMVEGPDGKGYFVRKGTIIGPNKGVVKKITQNTMVIEEKFKSFSGETEQKQIIIELRRKQEGTQ